MRVKDMMRRDVRGIEADASLVQAALQMEQDDVGWLPVFSDGKVIGVLSDRDIVIRGVAQRLDPVETKVREVMSSELIHCHEDDHVVRAAAIMKERKVRRLLVLDDDDWVAGSVSLSDLATKARSTITR